MAFDFVNVEIEDDDNALARIFGEYTGKYDHFVNEAVQDIGDEINQKASEYAPSRTGHLKANPTQTSITGGFIEKRAPLFVKKGETPGSQFAIRGAQGFTSGAAKEGGNLKHIEITLPGEHASTHYAYFVHYGTEQYAPIYPAHKQFLVFFSRGTKWRLKSVAGQAPQPYLTEAFEYVDHSYVPTRLEELRLEIEALGHT